MSEDENNKLHLIDSSTGQPGGSPKPIVLKLKKNKRKEKGVGDERKEKYSRGFEDIQRLDGNLTRITQKAAKAFSKGVDVYERERGQSAREKTDGAIEDFINNSAKAGSAYLKETADIPIDLAEAVSPVSSRKRLRRTLGRVSKFIRLFRI